MSRDHPGEFDELFRIAVETGRIDEPRGHAEGSRLHGLGGQALHGLQLVGGRPSVGESHGGRPDGPVAHQGRDVCRLRRRTQLVQELAEAIPPPGAIGGADHRLPEVVADRVVDRRRRQAAVAGDLGGHALAYHALRPAVGEEDEVGVVVNVDEAGGDDTSRRIQSPRRLCGLEVTDGDDPRAGNADIGAFSWRAGAIHHQPVLNDEVEGHAVVSCTLVPHRMRRAMRGSSRSRRPSPSMLMERTVAARNSPGKSSSQKATRT